MVEVDDVMKLLLEAKPLEALSLADKVKDKKEMAIQLTEFAGALEWLKEKSFYAGLILLKAIELYPDYALAHYNLGVVCTDPDVLKRHKEYVEVSEREYKKAVKLDPEFAAAHYNLALLYYFTQRFDESRKEYDTAVKLAPSELKFRDLGLLLQNAV